MQHRQMSLAITHHRLLREGERIENGQELVERVIDAKGKL